MRFINVLLTYLLTYFTQQLVLDSLRDRKPMQFRHSRSYTVTQLGVENSWRCRVQDSATALVSTPTNQYAWEIGNIKHKLYTVGQQSRRKAQVPCGGRSPPFPAFPLLVQPLD